MIVCLRFVVCLLIGDCWFLCVVCGLLLFVVCCLRFVVLGCLLFVVCCLWFVRARRLSFVVCCLLVSGLSFVVGCVSLVV